MTPDDACRSLLAQARALVARAERETLPPAERDELWELYELYRRFACACAELALGPAIRET